MNKHATPEIELATSMLMPTKEQLYFCSNIKEAARYAYNIMHLRMMKPLDPDIDEKAVEVFKLLKLRLEKLLKKSKGTCESIKQIAYWDELTQYICCNYPEVHLSDVLNKIV